jgi:phosphatidylserine/phosphatidylglycerophosphate/cardiolipin synthase-like enzyme
MIFDDYDDDYYYRQQATIKFIERKLNEALKENIFSCSDYVRYYSLRGWGVLDECIVTEQIYVHAKLLITDENIVIGSANINDRRYNIFTFFFQIILKKY